MKEKDNPDLMARLAEILTELKLKTAATELGPGLLKAGGKDVLAFMVDVFAIEARERRDRRIERLRRASHLPGGKTFETLEPKRLPGPLAQKLQDLAAGKWVEEAANVLAFGLPDPATYCSTSLFI